MIAGLAARLPGQNAYLQLTNTAVSFADFGEGARWCVSVVNDSGVIQSACHAATARIVSPAPQTFTGAGQAEPQAVTTDAEETHQGTPFSFCCAVRAFCGNDAGGARYASCCLEAV